jgi:hypothetical protein
MLFRLPIPSRNLWYNLAKFVKFAKLSFVLVRGFQQRKTQSLGLARSNPKSDNKDSSLVATTRTIEVQTIIPQFMSTIACVPLGSNIP